jgi:hypothetical protein
MPRKAHFRFFLLRWHRRIGVVAALFVLYLAVTGILLNHAHGLGLDQQPVTSAFWARVYGLPPPAAIGKGITLGSHELHAGAGKLYLDGQPIADCERLLGTVEKNAQVLVVCPRLLVLMTRDGQVIDQADTLRGVPSGLSAVAQQGDAVVLRRNNDSFAVDLTDLSVHPLAVSGAPAATTSLGSAQALMPAATQVAMAPELTRERLLQDLHSGRIMGPFGVWLMDMAAVLFAVLALSGLVMARRRRHLPH